MLTPASAARVHGARVWTAGRGSVATSRAAGGVSAIAWTGRSDEPGATGSGTGAPSGQADVGQGVTATADTDASPIGSAVPICRDGAYAADLGRTLAS
jgi:hypothetical protein